MSRSDSLAPPGDYLKTYSLSCEPFANTLDGRFFYAGPALMQRLDLMTHLTQFGDSVILVSGPPGSGKTTLLGRFIAQTGKQWRLCLINADEFVQFRQRLGDALRIGDNGSEQQMLEQWASQNDAAQLLVIVIDNIQLLQPDALQKLCDLLGNPHGERVRLIMFGTPEAQQAIKQALDRKDLPCTAQLLEIPKLSEEETAAYLMYRLAVAGYSGESPFTATEVRAICKAADGRPAAINQLAHDALLEHQMRARSKRLQPRKPGWLTSRVTWALGSLLVVALTFYLGWERLQPGPESVTQHERLAGTAAEIPLPLPQSRPATDASTTPPLVEAPQPAEAGKLMPAPEASENTPAAEPARKEPPPVAASLPMTPETAPAAASAAPAPVPEGDESATAENDQVSTAPAEMPARATEVSPPPVTTAIPAAPAPKSQPVEGTPPALGADAETTPATGAQPTPAASAAPEAKQQPSRTAGAAQPRREAWLLQQPANHYSLQLLGSRQQASILAYIRQNKLDPARCAYYHGNFQGGDWYVLMYGVYPDRNAALAARGELPARVQKEKPWPRSLASVHTAIRELQ